MDPFAIETRNALALLICSPMRAHQGIIHAFSTRIGGVSTSPYASLNLGLGSGDDRVRVQENRRRYSEAVGFDPESLVALRQVHGNRVAVLAADGDPGTVRGSPGDALITDRPNVPLAVITADCFPVILVAPSLPAVGIVHAGRKGTAAQVVGLVTECMCKEFRLSPEAVFAAIGPGIGGCCYEVDTASAEPFLSQYAPAQGVSRPSRPGHFYLNIRQAILRQLTAAGVPASQVWSANLCTACHPQWFYSYRREGQHSGRMLNVVMIDGASTRASDS